jgi:hypothetical protein
MLKFEKTWQRCETTLRFCPLNLAKFEFVSAGNNAEI